MTFPEAGGSSVVLDKELSGIFQIRSLSGLLAMQIDKSADNSRMVRLSAGPYQIERLSGKKLGVAKFNVVSGTHTKIAATDFVWQDSPNVPQTSKGLQFQKLSSTGRSFTASIFLGTNFKGLPSGEIRIFKEPVQHSSLYFAIASDRVGSEKGEGLYFPFFKSDAKTHKGKRGVSSVYLFTGLSKKFSGDSRYSFAVGFAQSLEREETNQDLGYPYYMKPDQPSNHPEPAFRVGFSFPVWTKNLQFSGRLSFRESPRTKWREAIGMSYQF